MSLSLAQKQAIKAYIDATPELASQPMTPDGAFAIAEALNAIAAPQFVVWRTNVSLDEIKKSPNFAWTLVDALTVGAARIWDWMFDNASRSIDASQANIRQGVSDVWTGTAAKLVVRDAVLAVCKRDATVAEKLLASGTGTSVSPATMSHEGSLSYNDVQEARAR